ncbi:hypothetical protein GX50_08845, partial [[Emmonsia] crescens]
DEGDDLDDDLQGDDDDDDDDEDYSSKDWQGKEATVQFRIGFETFVQRKIQLGKLVLTKDINLRPQIMQAVVTKAQDVSASSVSCQLFGDAEGTNKVGEPFSTMDMSLHKDGPPVVAIKCSVH